MKFVKIVKDGYVIGHGEVEDKCGGTKITEKKYNAICKACNARPDDAPIGKEYRLKDVTFEWELVDSPSDVNHEDVS